MITKMDEVLAAIAAGKSNTQIRDEVDRRLSDKSINKLRAHPANADVPWPEDARQAAKTPEGARSATKLEGTGGSPSCTPAPQNASAGAEAERRPMASGGEQDAQAPSVTGCAGATSLPEGGLGDGERADVAEERNAPSVSPAGCQLPQRGSLGNVDRRWPEGVICKRITYELQLDEAWSLITDGEHAKLKCQENTVISLPAEELLRLADRTADAIRAAEGARSATKGEQTAGLPTCTPAPQNARAGAEAAEGARSATKGEQTAGLPTCTPAPQNARAGAEKI